MGRNILKISLDNCCYNRPYDDQQQMRIFLETQAKLHIQQLIVQEKIGLVCSFVSRYENNENPVISNMESISNFFSFFSIYVGNENIEDIRKTSTELMKQGIKMKDVTHLACAIKAGCDYFITTDDKLLKKYSGTAIKLRTPLTFLEDMEAINA
jgi:predicted nucleic acid-binding protein